ncbi:MAG TPA: hypothetical protein VK557_05380 [Pyrinomonadaceae bacterium]|nr:hypothetical protein [Pyrinomonadaceae bacterium]
MPRKKPRKKHSVKASFRVMELAKAGSSIELEIFASNEKIGTLESGRGSLFWYGRSRQKGKEQRAKRQDTAVRGQTSAVRN